MEAESDSAYLRTANGNIRLEEVEWDIQKNFDEAGKLLMSCTKYIKGN